MLDPQQVQMRHVGITSKEAASFQMLGRYLVYPDMHLRRRHGDRQDPGLPRNRRCGRWRSPGDFPIFCLRSTPTAISASPARPCGRRNI